MKIIQIVSAGCAYNNDVQMFGLGDDGIVYYWNSSQAIWIKYQR